MTKLADKYRKLRALADDERTPEHERQLAGATADMLLELNPEIETELEAEADQVERDFPYRDQWERRALVHLGFFLDLESFSLKRRGRRIPEIRIVGPSDLVAVAELMWPRVRAQLRDLVKGSVAGWLWGALPYEVVDDDDDAPLPKLSKLERDAARAAAGIADQVGRPGATLLGGGDE